eukprot:TRINITY_DN2747_c0_g1_i14.p1 TRINITY_DN2747_c0_g1~~TRINITY_DN2747_c0_g1_i14.p1  ORF type:complete len:506 (+),score=186.68 TRINITY_DN2747_c0_g1_i14:43-1518(+)
MGDHGGTTSMGEKYAQRLDFQNLDHLHDLLSKDVTLSGLQHAEGRRPVLRELARLFRWYNPGELETRVHVVDKDKTGVGNVRVVWVHCGVEMWDHLYVNHETQLFEAIVRTRNEAAVPQAPQNGNAVASSQAALEAKAFAQTLASLQSILTPAKKVTSVTLPTLCTPRKQHFLNTCEKSQFVRSTAALNETSMLQLTPRSVEELKMRRSGTLASPGRMEPIQPAPPSIPRLPVLDFSFKDITHLQLLWTTVPRAGHRYNRRPVATAKQPRQRTPKTETKADKDEDDEDLVMVKAKTKDHGEVAYLWDKNDMSMRLDVKDKELLAGIAPPKDRPNSFSAFMAHSVKLSNNQLEDVQLLAPMLKMIVRYSVLHLRFLDLSSNAISKLPAGLEEFPLQVIYLHSNNIKSVDEVKKLAKITTLHSVTLWNNPFENKAAGNYKVQVLNALCAGFTGETQLRKLDHVVISRQDVQNCKMYREFTVVAKANNRVRAQP